MNRWFDWRLAIGLVIGIAIGFGAALLGGGATGGPVAIARMQAEAAPTIKDYAILVSGLFLLEGDVERARARLQEAGVADPGEMVVELAAQLLAAGRDHRLVADLASLGHRLGADRPELASFVELPLARAVLPVDWDMRLTAKLDPPVRHVPAQVESGQVYWRLVRARWLSPDEGHDAHHIFANVLNKDGIAIGQPIVIENGGKLTVPPEPKPDSEYLINYPMAGTLGSYTCYVAGDLPSDRVEGLGLGFAKGGKDHTCFQLTFQETVAR